MKHLCSLVSFCGLLLFRTGLFAQDARIAPDVQARLNDPNAPADIRVVVQFANKQSQGLLGLLDGVPDAVFDLIPANSMSVKLKHVPMLLAKKDVVYVSMDRQIKTTLSDTS